MAINHVEYQGRLSKDLEVIETQSGIKHATFTLCWNEKYKDVERKCYLVCKVWRQTCEFMEKFMNRKGQELIAEGSLETEEWDDKDGNKRSRIVLNVAKVHFCGKRDDSPKAEEPAQTAAPAATAVADEDLPF